MTGLLDVGKLLQAWTLEAVALLKLKFVCFGCKGLFIKLEAVALLKLKLLHVRRGIILKLLFTQMTNMLILLVLVLGKEVFV